MKRSHCVFARMPTNCWKVHVLLRRRQMFEIEWVIKREILVIVQSFEWDIISRSSPPTDHHQPMIVSKVCTQGPHYQQQQLSKAGKQGLTERRRRRDATLNGGQSTSALNGVSFCIPSKERLNGQGMGFGSRVRSNGLRFPYSESVLKKKKMKQEEGTTNPWMNIQKTDDIAAALFTVQLLFSIFYGCMFL